MPLPLLHPCWVIGSGSLQSARSAELQITLGIPEHQQASFKLLNSLWTERTTPPGQHFPTCRPQHLAGRQEGGTWVKISLPLNSWKCVVKTVDVLLFTVWSSTCTKVERWGLTAGLPPYIHRSYSSYAGKPVWCPLNWFCCFSFSSLYFSTSFSTAVVQAGFHTRFIFNNTVRVMESATIMVCKPCLCDADSFGIGRRRHLKRWG